VTVRNISEVKFFPEDYYWYRHCVFEIELQSGVSYIFDLTGVQFGPEWPLLSLRHVYEDSDSISILLSAKKSVSR
jgi:hypothetical protein